jgi:hypothetical protein
LDEATLVEIAAMTGAEYYLTESAAELTDVFANLPKYSVTVTETREISVVFTAVGALLAGLALLLAHRWQPLI